MNVCLFDIDGTLLNTGGAGQAAMEAALSSEFGAKSPVEGISTAGRTDRAITFDLFEYHGISADDQTRRRFVSAYLEHLPVHLENLDGLVLPGIPELLQQLSERNDVCLGLLTGNFQSGARLKLEHYELYHHFEFGGFGDDHLDRDDVAREALEQVHAHLNGNFDIARVWVVGDTPADIRCGRAIGSQVVAVGTGLYSMDDLRQAQPDHLFADFSDPELLLSLLD